MKLSNKSITTISLVVILISFLMWIILILNPGDLIPTEHCHVFSPVKSKTTQQYVPSSLKLCITPNTEDVTISLEKINTFFYTLLGWILMVIAMMLPKLIIPIQHIFSRSFKQYRLLYASIFTIGYIVVWSFFGAILFYFSLIYNLTISKSYTPAIIFFIIAMIWQCTPIKQYFLNLGHNHLTISAFGFSAFKDSFRFGIIHGIWCICSGWALMILPMLLPKGHNVVMILVTFIMISEHLEHPKTPAWRIDLRLKLFKLIITQTRLKVGTLK